MKKIDFLPPDDLIELIPSIATIQFTRNYSDYVQQLPIPLLKTEGISDKAITAEIEMLQAKINEEYPQIQSLAGEWFGFTEDKILQIFRDLAHFSTIEFHSYYDYIYHHNTTGNTKGLQTSLDRFKTLALNKKLGTKSALSALAMYEGDLSNYSEILKTTYNSAKNALKNLSSYTQELDEKRAELQEQLKANNQAVTNTTVSTTKKVIENGIVIATDAASENYTDAIKTGSILALNAAEAGVNIIKLDANSIKIIGEIKDLVLKLSDVERDLQVLNNAVAQMDSLFESHQFATTIITTLEAYWSDLYTYVSGLLENVMNKEILDLPVPTTLDKTWVDTIGNPIQHILSFTNLSSLSLWDVNKITFESVG